MKFGEFKTIVKNFFTFKPSFVSGVYDNKIFFIPLYKSVENGITSKTFYKLMTPEFTLDTNYEESGLRITTIIDRKTGAPVPAYVAKFNIEDKKRKKHQDDGREEYHIMVEDKAGDFDFNNKKYRTVGSVGFYINKEKQMVMPKFEKRLIKGELYDNIHEHMTANGNNDYIGIGTRLHQIRIERMLQENLGNSFIVAKGNSFVFHYELGYRLTPLQRPIEDFMQIMYEFSHLNNKPPKENKKYLLVEQKDGKYVINWSATLESFLCDYYKEGGKPIEDFMPNMYLNNTSLENWWEMIQKQTILGRVKIEKEREV